MAHKHAGQGAGITLVAGVGEFVALFDCARRIADVLDKSKLLELGDGIIESIPCYKIPVDELSRACQKLADVHSVSLVDYFSHDKNGGRHVLLWKIPCNVQVEHKPITLNVDDY